MAHIAQHPPSGKVDPTNGAADPVSGIDRTVEIERLAALESIDYEVARKEAADRLGIRASILDELRNQKRRDLKLDKPKKNTETGRGGH